MSDREAPEFDYTPPSVWDDSVAPGGYVCPVCEVPTESEPCADHVEQGATCPTCGPGATEPHPRHAGVTRCANCKEWLTSEDRVRLNHHVPNCDCQMFDGGRVALSATCAGWTKIVNRHIADAKMEALNAAADTIPTFEFMLLDPIVAEVAPGQIAAWLRVLRPGQRCDE